MRPNHQNKRMRGRNRGSGGGGGGKGPNPLTRSYETNGPDVKGRGTAQNIAEKYVQLGRDAQATGDHVTAESYFQHAEHYFRLIAAAQEQFRLQNPGFRGFDQPEGEGEDGEDEAPFGQGQGQPDLMTFGQPGNEGESEGEQRSDSAPRDFRQPRHPREQRGYVPREQRSYAPREGQSPDQPREPMPQGQEQPSRDFQPREPREPRPHREGGRFERGPRERFQRPAPMPLEAEQPVLPSFITAPVRPAPVEVVETPAPAIASETPATVEQTVPVTGVRRRGRPPKVRPESEPSAES